MEGCVLDATGVAPVLPLLGTALELDDLLINGSVSFSEGCSLTSPVEISRCNEDECTGEVDFLLIVSLPPREEFRGETLPVFTMLVSSRILTKQ